MDQLSDKSHNTPFTPLVAELTPELAQHLGDLPSARRLIQASLEQSYRTHRLATKTLVGMVATAQERIQAAAAEGRLTPLKEAALQHLTLAAMYEMLAIAADTDIKILDTITRW